MSKKKKTKKQKIHTDLKREIEKTQEEKPFVTPTYTLPKKVVPKVEQVSTNASIPAAVEQSIRYVRKDIKHTLVASGFILLLNAIIYLFRDQLFAFFIH